MIHHENGKQRSVPEVLQEMVTNLEDIARSELLLTKIGLKDEIKQEIAAVAKATRPLRAGVLCGIYAGGLFLLSAVYGLSTVMAPWLAALTIAVVMGIIAVSLIASGKSRLKEYAQSVPDKESAIWANMPKNSKDTLRSGGTVSTTTSVN